MSERRVSIGSPPAVDVAKLRDPRYTIAAESPSGKCLVHFDVEQGLGAIYVFEPAIWSIWGPMTFAAWATSLRDRGIVVIEGIDQQTWLDSVSREIETGELN